MEQDAVVLSDGELVGELMSWAGRVAAGEVVLLRLIGELDERGLWASEGSKSCAHWLAWKLGLTPGSAYERIRVAKALRGLPLLTQAMATGCCSYAQARAITRVATASCEATWIELAQHTTAAQLEKAARAVRRALTPDPEPAPKRASLTWDYDSDGWLRGSFLLHPNDAPAVVERLGQATRAEQADRQARRAEAEDTLKAQEAEPATPGPSAPGSSGTADSSAEISGPAGTSGTADCSAENSRSSGPSGPSGAAGSSGRSGTSGPSGLADFSAEKSGPPAPPYAPPCTYVEPPYPISAERLDGRALTPADDELVRQWWATRAALQAKADAARAWAEHVDQVARTQHAPSAQASRAAGLVRALTRPEDLPPSTVNLQVDPVSGWARTLKDELLPPSTLAAIAKTLPGRRDSVRLSDLQNRHVTVRPLTPADLTRADLGRRTRLISPKLRALLGTLDGERCRFPSCTASRHLHAHHVRYWRHGGPTDLANLVLVCSRHHTLIHTEGFQLVLSPDRTLTVRTAQDIPVPHHPPLPWRPAQDLTGPPHQSLWRNDPFDLDHIVWVLAQHSR